MRLIAYQLVFLILAFVSGSLTNAGRGNGSTSREGDTFPSEPFEPVASAAPSGHGHSLATLMSPIADVFGRRFAAAIDRARAEAAATPSQLELVRSRYLAFAKDLEQVKSELVSAAFPVLVAALESVEMSDACAEAIYATVKAFKRGDSWAMKMFDASGGLPSGVLTGTTSDLGDFDECLDVEVDSEEVDAVLGRDSDDHNHSTAGGHSGHFRGQHCLLTLRPALPPKVTSPSRLVSYHQSRRSDRVETSPAQDDGLGLARTLFKNTSVEGTAFELFVSQLFKLKSLSPMRVGLCLPSACSGQELEEAAAKFLVKLNIPVDHVSLGPHCSSKDIDQMPRLRASQLIALSIVLLVTLLALAGTALDMSGIQMKRRGVQSLVHVLLVCFSVRRNTRKLLYVPYVPKGLTSGSGGGRGSPDYDDHEDSEQERSQRLTSLHGLRVVLMVTLVVVNTFVFSGLNVFWSFRDGIKVYDTTLSSLWFQVIVLNGWTLLADAFLVVSGLIMTMSLLSKLEESKGQLNYLELIVHRWLRLFPAIVGALSLYVLWPLLVNGPLVTLESQRQVAACEASFWSSLLFVDNWVVDGNNYCVPTAWHVSVDFQMFVVGLLLVYVLHRNWLIGRRLIVAFVVLMSLLTAALAVNYDLSPAVTAAHLLDKYKLVAHVQMTLLPTFTRSVAYLMGILAGHFCYNSSKLQVVFSVMSKWAIFACLAIFNVLALVASVTMSDVEDNPWTNFTLNAMSRPLWAALVAWTCFAATSVGGTFCRPLSARPLVRMSRLVYAFTLCHALPILMRTYSSSTTRAWSTFGMLVDSFVNLIFALIAAYVLHVTFEAPLLGAERGIKARIEHNEVTKLRSLRAAESKVTDVEC